MQKRQGRREYSMHALEGRRLLTTASALEAENFTIGDITADPMRNVVYVVDQTDHKVLAVNTDSGRLTGAANLNGSGGEMAVSPTGDKLYVAEPGAQSIDVFALPNLNPLPSVDIGYPAETIAVGKDGWLYIATSEQLRSVDPATGAVSQPIPSDNQTSFFPPLFVTNPDGSHLYIRQLSVSGGMDQNVPEFDISNHNSITFMADLPSPMANSEDLAVDEKAHRLYTSDGGVYGVGVVNLDTGAISTWSMQPYGESVTTREDSNIVYGMTSEIDIFDKSTGLILGHFDAVTSNGDKIRMTENGRAIYTSQHTSLGIIGSDTLEVRGMPIARASATDKGRGVFDFSSTGSMTLSSTDSITNYQWDFGDGSTGTSATMTHAYTAAGTYTATLTVTNSNGNTGTMSIPVTIAASSAGGPYHVIEGQPLTLTGSAFDPLSDPVVSYDWDTNYDGTTFVSRATGASVDASALASDGPVTRQVAFRVTHFSGSREILATTVTVDNQAPAASFSATPNILVGQGAQLSFSNVADVAADLAGLRYSYDFNNDGVFDVINSDSSVANAPSSDLPSIGSYMVRGQVMDKDGGMNPYTATVNVRALPALSFSNASVMEGNSGVTNVVVTASLNYSIPSDVTVQYVTADGTAKAGSDYRAVSGTLTIPAGQTSASVTIPIIGDTVSEKAETLTVNFSSPTSAVLGSNDSATVKILNDDAGSDIVASFAPNSAANIPSGMKTTSSVSVKNRGNVNFKGSVKVSVYVSSDDQLDDQDLLVGTVTQKLSLKTGTSKSLPISMFVPSSMSGNYQLITVVDSSANYGIGLSDVPPLAVNVAPPDRNLTASISPVHGQLYVGSKLSVDFTVTNTGNTIFKGKTMVALLRGIGTTIDFYNDAGLRPVNLNLNLAPGQSKTVTFKFSLKDGSYTMYGIIDPLSRQEESNKNDNLASDYITIVNPFHG